LSALAKYLRYSHVGVQFLVAVGLPTAGGIWADQRLGTGVLLTLLGLVLGFAAGVYSLYREVYGFGERDRDSRAGSSPPTSGEAPTARDPAGDSGDGEPGDGEPVDGGSEEEGGSPRR
jgi:hypothetical protein